MTFLCLCSFQYFETLFGATQIPRVRVHIEFGILQTDYVMTKIDHILQSMSQEQEKIQKYIIKSTPYGELTEVLKDLQKLTTLDILSPTITNAIEEYHEEHLALVPLKNGKQSHFTLMNCSKVESGRYLDQLNKKIYTVDHLKKEIIAQENTTVELVQSVEQLLSHLSRQANAYAAKYYKQPFGAQVFMNLTEESLDTYVGITGKNVQLGNFYTGQWVSKWKVQKTTIEGTINIRAHFFESGNVQFNQKKNVSCQFQFQENMENNAKNIIKVIEKYENEIQSKLGQLYEEMEEGFFKKLRRIAPFTKTKMNWNVNSVKMNKNIMGFTKDK